MQSLDKQESIVFEIVEEFLGKKTFFSVNDIVEFINNRVRYDPSINRNRIEQIIKSFIRKRIIIPGRKLMKSNIIENRKRNEILTFIDENPGMNINEIMRNLDLGSNLALWHLSTLEKFQFIRSKKISNQVIFFEFGTDPEFDELHYYLRQEIIQAIIQFMKEENKPLKITEIVTSLKKNHNTIKKYLKVLRNLKIIRLEKEKKTFELDHEYYSEVQKLVKIHNHS